MNNSSVDRGVVSEGTRIITMKPSNKGYKHFIVSHTLGKTLDMTNVILGVK